MTKSLLLCCATTGLSLALGAARAGSQTVETETQKLLPPDFETNDFIGVDVAASGDWLFVGAPQDAVTVGTQGSVRSYRWAGDAWVESDTLVASDPSFYSNFGQRLALAGDTLIVAAPTHDSKTENNQGLAYAFRLQGHGWVEEQQLFPEGYDLDIFYASAVATSGDRAFIFGRYDDTADGGLAKQPAVFIFEHGAGGWTFESALDVGDPADLAQIPELAAEGERLVVGFPSGDGPAGPDQGFVRVYLHQGAGWVLEATLVASDAVSMFHFGSAVAIEGNRIAVGAGTWGLYGAIYVFREDGGDWVQEFLGAGSVLFGTLGASAALEGPWLFAGDQTCPASARAARREPSSPTTVPARPGAPSRGCRPAMARSARRSVSPLPRAARESSRAARKTTKARSFSPTARPTPSTRWLPAGAISVA